MQQEPNDETWLEEQCLRELEAQNDYERDYHRQRDNSISTVWGAFQDSATAVAQLYRERSNNAYHHDTGALWLPFQTAAGTVTTLYKDSCEGIKRTGEAGIQSGYQRRTRELVDWARSKKRRVIRRADLLAYLAGKPPPPLNVTRRSPKPEHSSNALMLGGPASNSTTSNNEEPATDLHTFKEALVLRPRGPELFAFVANEIARHCKRPASPLDDTMDVCHYSSKRQRFM
ncbi:HUWE1-associated protein modifying stress responses [Eupeodes corollae]|uniref:HUWE1-associated protein modifying stress responses n=1 Tax=Eupeodes corollae TaxID=290404 RepID=UPI0024932840|nr:HUWE1-associated protein modifying stress responses [Eupeodes corollae]